MFSHQKILLLLGDVLALVLSLAIMAIVRFDVGAQGTHIWYEVMVFGVMFLIWLIVFFIFDLYDISRINPNARNIGQLVAAMGVNTVLAVVLFYLTPNTGISPKTNLAILIGTSFILLLLWRRAFYHLYAFRFKRRIALIGSTPTIHLLSDALSKHSHIGIVVGHWDTTPRSIENPVDLIIAHQTDPYDLHLLSQKINAPSLSLLEAYASLLGTFPLELMSDQIALDVLSSNHFRGNRFFTRALEILIASIVLIVTAPIILLAAIAIYLEDGSPIFYGQTRVGKNNASFIIYKLRSMKKRAEKLGAQWAEETDPRITRVGKILRKTHIDEIPQMYNIIRGDLALIGPRAERPEFVAELEKHIPYYYLRHTIRPGFTGWAQIKYRYARSIADSKEKFEYDLYYIRNKNILLDIGISLKTIQIIFTH